MENTSRIYADSDVFWGCGIGVGESARFRALFAGNCLQERQISPQSGADQALTPESVRTRIYEALMAVLRQCRRWVDIRHMKTLAWMVTGLLLTEKISLSAWAPVVHSQARYAQSTVRRFARWLDNERIQASELYGPLIEQALAG